MAYRISSFACILCTTLLVAGCTTQPDSLAYISGEHRDSGWSSDMISAEIKTALNEVEATKNRYYKGSKSDRNIQAGFDSSLIAVATGALSAAFFGASKDVIGGLGIGAGALSAYRSYYNPEQEGLAYLKGYQALRCITTTSKLMLSANPGGLRTRLTELQTKLDRLPNDAKNAATIQAASSALRAGNGEITAYNSAPLTIRSAADAIANGVELATHRTSVNISDVQSQINTGLTFAQQGSAAIAEARANWSTAVKDNASNTVAAGRNVKLVTAANSATEVTTATGTLLNLIPQPAYTDIMARISTCTTAQ